MRTHSVSFKGILTTACLASVLILATGYTSTANAAQGCGEGYHRSVYGGCILNYPGHFARPAPEHPGCWRNMWGALRCPR